MELWYTEYQTKNLGLTCRIKETLFQGQSEFQEVAVVDSLEFGRMLVLDGVFQTSVFDEYIYHEMIVHVPLCTHANPKKILVIGGGDGGAVRETVKHAGVESVEMVEIDGLVVDVSKKFLPEISAALLTNHPKVQLKIGDGIKHMAEAEGQYDVIIVDCSDPIGPGEGLFTPEFYRNVHKALKADGLFVQQTESPFYHQDLIRHLYRDIAALFPLTRLYLANIPLYPGGLHCFTMGSKKYDPLQINVANLPELNTRYYNGAVHKACFELPNFIRNLIR
ncbi:s-adenosyl-l-methionine-dependent methyltransferase [Lucifera butyrica]|uniref:Polyamine aminopropyltransferase n=1 Tax=Lucifera butyrica TaxID=1351585 RepID=A0A498R909_9FIRM|nr:polyamine aminopropyltransferase [Lucifera butyrica]VBB07410.1 s-adenosyl-l-methionine-dependent methyltransferase [Lucifera butyrica]